MQGWNQYETNESKNIALPLALRIRTWPLSNAEIFTESSGWFKVTMGWSFQVGHLKWEQSIDQCVSCQMSIFRVRSSTTNPTLPQSSMLSSFRAGEFQGSNHGLMWNAPNNSFPACASCYKYGYGSKLGTPKLWMVNTQLDIHICGPTSVFHFDPHPYTIIWW